MCIPIIKIIWTKKKALNWNPFYKSQDPGTVLCTYSGVIRLLYSLQESSLKKHAGLCATKPEAGQADGKESAFVQH